MCGLSYTVFTLYSQLYNRLYSRGGCTTGWVNYANESSQAALERSIQYVYDVIRLTRSKAAVWTVRCDAFNQNMFIKILTYLFIFTLGIAY